MVSSHTFKLILVGETGVGKTTLFERIGRWSPEYPCCTMGIDFLSRRVELDDIAVTLQCWDTAGFERFRSLSPAYYRGVAAAILAYDISSQQSFDKVESWLGQVRQHSSDEVLLVLVGCKSDLSAHRQVDPDIGFAYAMQNGCLFLETSAYTNQNVDDLCETLARKLWDPSIDRSFGPSVALSLGIDEFCGYGSRLATITATNLAGTTVATVEVDLASDSMHTLRKAIAERTGVHINRQALVFGQNSLCDIDGAVSLATCFHPGVHCETASNSTSKLPIALAPLCRLL